MLLFQSRGYRYIPRVDTLFGWSHQCWFQEAQNRWPRKQVKLNYKGEQWWSNELRVLSRKGEKEVLHLHLYSPSASLYNPYPVPNSSHRHACLCVCVCEWAESVQVYEKHLKHSSYKRKMLTSFFWCKLFSRDSDSFLIWMYIGWPQLISVNCGDSFLIWMHVGWPQLM